MINTVNIKQARDEVFTLQSDGRPWDVVLIVGSCRCVAYLNYFKRFNEANGHPLRVHFIEPNDYCINAQGQGVNELGLAENNPRVLEAVQSATVFFHEHYENYGMFNTNLEMEKNIYQFGMKAAIDVTIPNFHDRFILFTEQLQFRRDELQSQSRESAITGMTLYGLGAVHGFCDVCRKSSFPEFSDHFLKTWTKLRYFWTGNHISRHFHLYIFRQLNDRFLRLPLNDNFWTGAATEDLFAKPCAPVTQEDVDAYGLTWDRNESPIVPLQLP